MSGLSTSKVEWMRGGRICNAITGCLRRCDYCWAWDQTKRWPERYLANKKEICGELSDEEFARYEPWHDPFFPRWWPESLQAVYRLRKPTAIWMVNMGDAFGPWVPDWMIQDMLQVAKDCPQHTFYWLTKFPERLPDFNPWPDNCWVGATATDEQSFRDAVAALSKVQATTKYLSMEPLLGWPNNFVSTPSILLEDSGISWVITGPCNGRLAKQYSCKAEWLQDIADACTAASVPLFEKKECGRWLKRPLRKEFPDG